MHPSIVHEALMSSRVRTVLCAGLALWLGAALPVRAAEPGETTLLQVTSGTQESGAPAPAASAAPATRVAAVDSMQEVRECAMVCKGIQDAIERYNRWWRIGKIRAVNRESLQRLVDKHVLSAMPVDPGQGPGSESHFTSSVYGPWVSCTYHTRERFPPPAPAPAPKMSAGEAVRTIGQIIQAVRQQAVQTAPRR